ncbi:MAG: FecR domain-containing protein [Sneathiella sp.]|nr:FecR domain-containing protein [Sneathiella sp.]
MALRTEFESTNSTNEGASGQAAIVETADGPVYEIPLGSFIMDADYARNGQDLVLKDTYGREVTLDGYFQHSELPPLQNEFGAKVLGSFAAKLAGPGQYAQSTETASTLGEPVGAVENISGNATVLHKDGTSEKLEPGSDIYQDDVIETDGTGNVGILLKDGAIMGVGPGSRMTIDSFVYDAGTDDGNIGLSFLKGAVSFVSGKIAKNDYEDVNIKVPYGSIGIRGTEFVVDTADSGIATVFVLGGRVITFTGNQEVILTPGQLISIAATGLTPVQIQTLQQIQQQFKSVIEVQENTRTIRDGRGEADDGVNASPAAGGQNNGEAAEGEGEDTAQESREEDLGVNFFDPNLVTTNVGDLDIAVPFDVPPDFNSPFGTNSDDFLQTPSGGIIFQGTEGPDVFDGTSFNDQAFGYGGNDTLSGSKGDDLIDGGDGDDYLQGGEGSVDYLLGGDGDDVMFGDNAEDPDPTTGDDDTMLGDGGNDRMFGGGGQDSMFGGTGNDLLSGEFGNDSLYGGDGRDTLLGGDGDDLLSGEDGDDFFYGGDGMDSLSGGAGNDRIMGDDGNDLLYGDGGDDVLSGGRGEDLLFGGLANDVLLGHAGSDTLSGDEGNDLMFGGDDNDMLLGGSGSDAMYGGEGQDILLGGAGNDFMDGQWGDDFLSGGDGIDIAQFVGNFADFDIQVFGDQFTVRNSSSGDIDILDSIEKLHFNDGEFSLVSFSLSGDAEVSEEGSASYRIELGGAELETGQSATIEIALTDIDTTSGDYQTLISALQEASESTPGVSFSVVEGAYLLTFDGGAGNATALEFSLDIPNDYLVEGLESFGLSIGSPSGDGPVGNGVIAVVGTAAVVTEITDGVLPTPDWQLSELSGDPIAEGGAAQFEISFTGADIVSGSNFSIDVGLDLGDTDAGDFNEGLADALSLAAGLVDGVTAVGTRLYFDENAPASFSFDLTTLLDGLSEASETFTVTIQDPQINDVATGTVSVGEQQSTITDGDELTVALTGDAIAPEGGSADYTISLDGAIPAGETVSVDVSVLNNGTSSADYADLEAALATAAAGTSGVTVVGNTVTFDSTATDFTFALDITSGDGVEAAEQFSVEIGNPVISNGAAVSIDGSGEVSTDITEGDSLTVGFTQSLVSRTEGQSAAYTILLSGLAVGMTALPAGAEISFDLDLSHVTTDEDDLSESLIAALSSLPAGVTAEVGDSGVTISITDAAVFDGGELALNFDLGLVAADELEPTESFNIDISGLSGTDINVSGGTTRVVTEVQDDGINPNIATTGDDDLSGDDEAEEIDALSGNDLVHGLDGDDTLLGSEGADTLYGDGGFDSMFGGTGNDSLFGGDGNDQILGGTGDDYLNGGNDNDWLDGENGADTMLGGDGDDQMYGSQGADEIYGEAGFDRLYGGDQSDLMSGGMGNDTLQGADGADTLYGNEDEDVLIGGSGGDLLDGGTGHDQLFGDSGNDTLIGGNGFDRMTGGADVDVFAYETQGDGTIVSNDDTFSGQHDEITDFQTGQDILQLASEAFGFDGGYTASDDFVTTIGGQAYDGTNADLSGGQNTGEAKLIFDGTYLYYDNDPESDGYTVIAEVSSGTVSGDDVVVAGSGG